MNNKTIVTTQVAPPEWSEPQKLTPEDHRIFHDAMLGFVGALYTPKSVATQQEKSGKNYRFTCGGLMPPAVVRLDAMIEIFKPDLGAPYITGIYRI